MTTLRTALTKALVAGSVALSAVMATSTASQALVIHNCTNDRLPVAISHVPSGRKYTSHTIKPGDGVRWDTGRGKGFRVSINVIGPDKRFSNRNGGEVISIKKIAGNTELVNGHVCGSQEQASKPQMQRNQGLDAKDLLAASALALILNELSK